MIGETVSLGEVCEILDTLRKPITKKFRKQGQYPYYGATGIVDYVDNYIFDETLVLIGEDGAKWDKGDQTAFIATGKYWVNNHAHVIRPLKDKLNQKFLVYYLNSIDLKPWVTGLTVPKLNQEKLKSIPIPLFTIDEQKRFVAKLDTVSADINNLKININNKIINSKKLYENFLTQSFLNGINIKRWPLEKLKNYNEVVVGYVGPISKEYSTNNDDVLLLSTKNISSGEIDLKKLTRIKRSFHLKNKKSQLTIGDIIVARHGNSGEAAVVNHKIKEAHALNVIIIKKGNKILSEYISFLLNSGVLKKITESKSGSVQEIINTSIIKNLTIPIPSIEEQRTLIRKINLYSIKTKSLEKLYKKKLIEIDALKNSIIKKNLINRAV